jgi:hypothetical protein
MKHCQPFLIGELDGRTAKAGVHILIPLHVPLAFAESADSAILSQDPTAS